MNIKKSNENDEKKLKVVVVYISAFVLLLFGLVP